MTNEELHIRMMEYLYGELDESERLRFEKYLEEHPSEKKELEELRETGTVLRHAEADKPKHHFTLTSVPVQPASSWWQYSSFRMAAAVAACVVLFFTAGAISGLHMNFGQDGFSVAFGGQSAVSEGFTPGQVQEIVAEIQQQNLQTMNELISASELQQREQIEETLTTFMDYLDTQRLEDFRSISRRVQEIQSNTASRFRQNEMVLGEIIETVNLDN